MYHLSKVKLKEMTLLPRIPNNFLTRNGFEERNIARISFSPKISSCLMAMARCIKGETFYVYKIEDGQEYSFISNKEIVEKGYVPDASITGEMWIVTPIKVKLVKKIKVTNASEKMHRYVYNKKNNKEAELYEWNWKEISKEKKQKNKSALASLLAKEKMNLEKKDYFEMQVRKQVEVRKKQNH
jgi:hypothetical protein